MTTPTRNTIMRLAVASACSWIALSAQAQAQLQSPVEAQPAPAGAQAQGAAAQQAAPAPEAAVPASAPEAAAPAGNVVTVSGSRIAARGFTQPTPTTTLSADDLAKGAQPNIFNSIAELPALQGSTGRTTSTNSTSSGVQGLSSLSLRGLGAIRTLTLLDGQRVVGANVTGVTDVSQFPQLLIKRVDVVTGGASASYGSDAIGGVVNFITDKRFKGVKANVQGGQTTYHDDKNGSVQAAWGDSFMDDRLHVQVSGEYGRQKGIEAPGFGEVGPNGRTWFQNPAFQIRPIGQTNDGKPQYTSVLHAQQYQYAKYGLITNGPLQGTAFGDGGQPYKFNYGSNGVPTGTGSVTGCINPFCIGGDLSGSVGAGTNLAMDLTRQVAYTRVGFDINPDHEIYMTANFGKVKSEFTPNPGAAKNANLTVQCSNPYLPASIAAACAANNITSFQYGTANAIFPENINVHPTREMNRLVLGGTGKFQLAGKEWSYDAYAEHGVNKTDIVVHDMTLNARYNAAIDVVRGPDGSIVCRNAVAAANGCRPLNIIGNNPVDAATWSYIAPENGPRQQTRQTQDVASVNFSGEAFASWAGPIAVATGAEYRREHYRVTGDPYGNGIFADSPNTADYPADPLLNTTVGNNWYAGNYHNAQGTYNVKEAYVELNVPVLKSATWGEANFNLADRHTKYSTSGHVESWKVGANWKTGLDGWRLRAVTSKDVRAPNLSELYAAQVVVNNVVAYQGNTIAIQQRTVGNTRLRPEIARNTTAGIVLSQPSWAPGFSASIDYFDIKVKGVISALTAQQEVDLCVEGNQEICSAMVLNNPIPTNNYVTVQAFNLASLRSKGYDLEGAYRMNLKDWGVPGRVTLRALVTRNISFMTDPGVVGTIPSEGAGANLGNTPKWKGLASQSWDSDKYGLTLTERWISKGVYSNEYIECQTTCPVSTTIHPTIFNNKMKGAFYVDLGGSYKINDKTTAYFKVDNIGNVDPAAAPQANLSYGINPALYDVLGRVYRAGVRYNF
jgi:outer membrane receptor protein involved in Fe transport